MRLSSPLAVVLTVALLLAAVLGSVALWGSGASGFGTAAEAVPTGDRQAIFTATPAPTPTSTPIPTGEVVEVVYRCMLYFYALDYFRRQESSDVDPNRSCAPPHPPDLIIRGEDGEPLYEVRGLQLSITVRRDSGDLFEVAISGPFSIAIGDSWPVE